MARKRILADSDDDDDVNSAPLAAPSGERPDPHNKADHGSELLDPPAHKKRDTAADKGAASAPSDNSADPAPTPAGRQSPEPRLSTDADPPHDVPAVSPLAVLPHTSHGHLEPPPPPPTSVVNEVLLNAMDPAAYQQDWEARSELSSASSRDQSTDPADAAGLPGPHQASPVTVTASTEHCNEYTKYLPGNNPQPVTKALRQTIDNEFEQQRLRFGNGAPVKVHGFSVANEVHYLVNDRFTFTPAGLECHAEPARPYKNLQTPAELFPLAPLNYKNARRPGFARNCALASDKGAAMMLKTLFQSLEKTEPYGSLLYDENKSAFYTFLPHWKKVEPSFIKQLIGTIIPAEYIHAREEAERALRKLGTDKSFNARRKELESTIALFCKAIKKLATNTATEAVMSIAKGELSIHRHCNQGPDSPTPETFWDPPSLHIGAANGVLVSLVDGSSRQAVPSDRVSKASSVEWKGLEEPAPLWLKLVTEALGNDHETIDSFQVYWGYSLTGDNKHSVLIVMHGPNGSNGKSRITRTVEAVLGPFVKPISHSVLVQPRKAAGMNSNSHTSDLADLEGVRIGFVSETQDTDEFRNDRVKMITGGDTVCVRRAHAPAGYSVTMKMVPFLITNELPSTTDQEKPKDSAMVRRLVFVNFVQQFVADPKAPNEHLIDPTLLDRILKGELSGVLAWLVRGAVRYHSNGSQLRPSAAMKGWANAYWGTSGQDPIARFAAQMCEQGPDSRTTAQCLYEAYCRWCESVGETAVSNQLFGVKIVKTIPKTRTGAGWFYKCKVRGEPVPPVDQPNPPPAPQE